MITLPLTGLLLVAMLLLVSWAESGPAEESTTCADDRVMTR